MAVLEDLAERGLDAGPTRPALPGTRLSCVSVRCEMVAEVRRTMTRTGLLRRLIR